MDAAQLEFRRGLLTATDAAAICGVSKWRSAHDVYLDKRGLGPRFEGNSRTRAGQALEPVIIALGNAEHGLSLVGNSETLVAIGTPWLGATPDAFEVVSGVREGVGECKAVGFDMLSDWSQEDGPPDYVLTQVTVQMRVANVRRCRVLALLGTDIRLHTVEFDSELCEAIMERLVEFKTRHLDANVPPPPDGSASASRMLATLFPRSRKHYVDASPALDTLAHQILLLRSEEKEIEKRRSRLEQEMQAILGDAEGVRGQDWSCSWKTVEAAEVQAYTRAAYRRFTIRAKGASV